MFTPGLSPSKGTRIPKSRRRMEILSAPSCSSAAALEKIILPPSNQEGETCARLLRQSLAFSFCNQIQILLITGHAYYFALHTSSNSLDMLVHSYGTLRSTPKSALEG